MPQTVSSTTTCMEKVWIISLKIIIPLYLKTAFFLIAYLNREVLICVRKKFSKIIVQLNPSKCSYCFILIYKWNNSWDTKILKHILWYTAFDANSPILSELFKLLCFTRLRMFNCFTFRDWKSFRNGTFRYSTVSESSKSSEFAKGTIGGTWTSSKTFFFGNSHG